MQAVSPACVQGTRDPRLATAQSLWQAEHRGGLISPVTPWSPHPQTTQHLTPVCQPWANPPHEDPGPQEITLLPLLLRAPSLSPGKKCSLPRQVWAPPEHKEEG